MKILVPVYFRGEVEVEISEKIPAFRREDLARSVALARLLATTENPDAPEDAACEEYADIFNLTEATSAKEWDSCRIDGVSGVWQSEWE